MKKSIIIILLVAVSSAILSSCRDESKIIYDTSKLPTGAYVRNLTLPDETVTISSFSSADFTFKGEVVGVNSASDITSLDIQVRYIDDTGTAIKDYVSLGSITSWAVESNTSGLPRGTVTFKGSDILTKLSITTSDLIAKNFIEYSLKLKLKDGRVYDSSNFDPNMSNTFYLAGYDFATELK